MMKKYLSNYLILFFLRKKQLATFAAILCMMPMMAQQTVVNVVEQTAQIERTSTLYVGEVLLDEQQSFYYLYSEDMTNTSTVLAAVRDCLQDFKSGIYSTLISNEAYIGGGTGITACSNSAYESMMNSGWMSAENAGLACLPNTTATSSSSENLFETNADFAANCLNFTNNGIELLDEGGEPLAVSGVLGVLSSSSTDDVTYTVIGGQLVKLIERTIEYNCESVTVIYTSAELETQMTLLPLTFEAIEAGTITVNLDDGATLNAIQYNLNNDGWTDVTWNTAIELVANDVISFRGDNGTCYDESNWAGFHFECSSNCYVYGNMMSLIDKDDFATNTELTETYTFYRLFQRSDWEPNTTILNHPNYDIVLPATTLTINCYDGLFADCQGITRAPALPATELAEWCYSDMFAGCTGLTATPSLPATTMQDYCYNDMFGECTALTTAPALPATALALGCYAMMFWGCTSLETAPALPATILADECYVDMFHSCTALTTAPALPATTLAVQCYANMFDGCTSLTTAPVLPATTLVSSCYGMMFNDCSSLQYVKCLATDLGDADGWSTFNWLAGVSATGIFVKASGVDWSGQVFTEDPDEVSGIPVGWTVQDFSTFDPYTTPLTLEAISDGNITFAYSLSYYHNQELTDIEYQINGGTWTTYTWNNPIAVVAGDIVAFRGNNAAYNGNGDYESHIVSTADVYVYGNVMSLIISTDYATLTTLTGKNAFSNLFSTPGAQPWEVTPNTTIKSHPTKELVLPATTLTNMCYSYMFAGCQGLTRAPELPATEMTVACYASMFEGCTSLTTAPALPTTTFTPYSFDEVTSEEYGSIDCYMMMFKDCTSLTEAPELPATTLTHGVYQFMFNGCTSLTTAPELPATDLTGADQCYTEMFEGCTSLEEAPALPATTLDAMCYAGMFSGCTSLTEAPELPATTLAEDCYHRMFEGCTSLTAAPELPAATLIGQCYGGMFDGCTSLQYVKCLATDLGEFDGVHFSIADWLNNVASTGTFIKALDMEDWPIDSPHGIPEGWTVKEDMTNEPLTFEAMGSTLMIKFSNPIGLYGLQYRTYTASSDTWSEWQTIQHTQSSRYLSVSGVGSKIQFKKENTDPMAQDATYYCNISNSSGNCYIYGNIMSLFNFETTLEDYACCKLFDGNTKIRNHPTKDLILGATTLTNCCYQYMFRGCTGLTRIPELPATTLANNCYYDMFRRCTALNTKPVLPATALAYNCYRGMFQGCTALTTPPDLPATTLAESCYGAMFADCTNLQAAPELPATTLEESCYGSMFSGCTSLTTAPELPATTLATDCYNHMFDGCTGLTATPELPATTMAHKCYYYMFYGCTNLTSAPALPSTELATWCYNGMFYNCANLAEAPVLPATTLFEQCYADMFHGTSLATAPVLPATTLAKDCYAYMFALCPSLNYVKCFATDILADDCTLSWLAGVASTGTFIKAPGMTEWTENDPSGIPTGWTAYDKIFQTEGDWNVAANWNTNAVPADGSNVVIEANATIPSNYTANAGNVFVAPSSTLTIADGGQLIHSNNVNATLQKNINAYSDQQGVNDGWYTIASPVVGDYSTEGLTIGTYDLYLYNEPTHYWWNAKGDSQNNQSFTTLGNGQGYLYANSTNQTLAFAGETQATNATVTVPLSYTATAGSLQGYNLVGNPFTRNLTAGDIKLGDANLTSYYYVSNGSEFSVTTVAERPIKPGEGFFVQASAATNLVFNPATAKGGTYTEPAFIRIEVGNGHFMDYAYVQIGHGNTLRKMSLNDNATKVCVMNDGMDYAAATIEAAEGEMPVNFKAAGNGTYTISVRTENLNLAYLHLIDNLTGNEVDLLATPSYTFEAKTTDCASRFRLVFDANENGASTGSTNFAYINNGDIVILGDVEGATLQVVDMMGHVLVCREVINSLSTNGMTPGVYVLRLINGENVKTQKIVIDR